jgi:O-antigen/teichoic acid export membrane protein
VVIVGAVGSLELVIDPIIRIAFGRDFEGASACAHWLVAASGLLDFRRVLIAILQGRDRGGQASVIEIALTPFLVLGIVLAALAHNLVGVSLTMGGVGVIACVMLGFAVARSAPGTRYVPSHALARQARS